MPGFEGSEVASDCGVTQIGDRIDLSGQTYLTGIISVKGRMNWVYRLRHLRLPISWGKGSICHCKMFEAAEQYRC